MADNQTIDLSNVPREPYTHQEYPKVMYHADGGVKIANNADEEKALAKQGHKTKPQVGYAPAGTNVPAAEPAGDDVDEQEEADVKKALENEEEAKKGKKK